MLTKLKKKKGFQWLQDPPASTLQQTLRDLEKAIKDGYSKKKGFPKFKARDYSTDSARFNDPKRFTVKRNEIYLPKVGWVKFQSRCNIHKKEINYITVKYDRLKDCFIASINFNHKIKPLPKTGEEIGLDVGSVRMYTDSEGNYKKPIRELNVVSKLLTRLEKEQRKFSDILEKLKEAPEDKKLLKYRAKKKEKQ